MDDGIQCDDGARTCVAGICSDACINSADADVYSELTYVNDDGVTSTGTDAAPYFRIFNPYTQSKKFDAKGIFIKKYCPELLRLNGKTLHDPATLPPAERSKLDYPEPMVDHKQARERALRAFQSVKP